MLPNILEPSVFIRFSPQTDKENFKEENFEQIDSVD